MVEAASVRESTGRQCGAPQHMTQCSLSCLVRIAMAPEELSESDLNEIIAVWQRKSRLFEVHFS